METLDLSRENVLSAINEISLNKIPHLPGNWDFRSEESKIDFLQKNVGLFFVDFFIKKHEQKNRNNNKFPGLGVLGKL